MRLRTAADDLASILLVEIPRSLRLVVLVGCVLVAYVTGLAWTLAAGYQTEVVRLEGRAEVRELRKQIEQVWGAFEYVKTGLDRLQLEQVPRQVSDDRKVKQKGG